ncbi:MAG: hypothetical protein GY950_19470 [bacterium]|nr:hypothetical protein [bacterium]
MEITTEIREAHERLSRRNIEFLDYVKRNPGAMRAENYHLLELNDPLYTLQPWPTFISRQRVKEMSEASLEVLKLIKSIPRRIFSNDPREISRYYGVSTDLAGYFLYGVTDEHLDNLLARGDFLVTRSGLKCLEFNINTNLGGLNLPLWETLCQAVPVLSRFFSQYNVKPLNKNVYTVMLEHLVNIALSFYPGTGEFNIAVAAPSALVQRAGEAMAGFMNAIFTGFVLPKFSGLKGRVMVCNYSQLETVGEEVFCNGKKVHYIMEWCQGFAPKKILELFKERKILFGNGAVSWLLSTKLNHAVLSEYKDSGLFTPPEREIIETYIPWTRKVAAGETVYRGETVDMKTFLLANRETLVLKPILGAGGRDVQVGRHMSGEEWKALVESALQWEDWMDIHFDRDITETAWYQMAEKAFKVKNWVVQEYVPFPRYLYQWGKDGYVEHHSTWGIFMFGGTYAGTLLRVQPWKTTRGVINCLQGATVSIVFEVDK